MKKETKFVWLMSLVIIGVSVGAGILGLPLQLGLTGFFPALTMLILIGAMTFAVGLIYIYKFSHSINKVEDFATLYQEELGFWGKFINSIAYLFTFYCLMVAFICAGSAVTVGVIPQLDKIPHIQQYIDTVFSLLVAFAVVYGIGIIKRLNAFLVILLFVSFLSLLIFIFPYFKISYLMYQKWDRAIFTMPILVTAFGYQIVLPVIYKHGRATNISEKSFVKILLFGTIAVLFINAIWIVVVLGVLPVAASNSHASILYAYKHGLPVTIPLVWLTRSYRFVSVALVFSLFAIITSYIGVATGVMSYIKDLTAHYFKKRNKVTDILITFVPSLIFALTYPGIFIKMLSIVGGLGIITSFGILPGLVAIKSNNALYIRFFGGFVLMLSLFIFIVECFTLVMN